MKPEMLLVLPVFIVVPLVMAGVIVRSIWRRRRWSHAAATVVAERSWQCGPFRMDVTGQPIPIVFHLPNGREVTGTLKLGQERHAPKPGTAVRIIYDPNDPRRVEACAGIVETVCVLVFIGSVLALAVGYAWKGMQG